MIVHIHAPQPTDRSIHYGDCPDCQRKSWFVGFFTNWYGWDVTCLRCGREFGDGEWKQLPFMPQARAKSILAAKKRWRKFNETPKNK